MQNAYLAEKLFGCAKLSKYVMEFGLKKNNFPSHAYTRKIFSFKVFFSYSFLERIEIEVLFEIVDYKYGILNVIVDVEIGVKHGIENISLQVIRFVGLIRSSNLVFIEKLSPKRKFDPSCKSSNHSKKSPRNVIRKKTLKRRDNSIK